MDDVEKNLIEAVKQGRTDIVKSVIETLEKDDSFNIDVDKLLNKSVCETGTLLHLGVKLDLCDVARTLLRFGVDPCVYNTDHQTALDLARSDQMISVFNQHLLHNIAANNLDCVDRLLRTGVDIHALDSVITANTPLHWAATYSDLPMIRCLCSHGAQVNALNSEGLTPLDEALKRNQQDIIEELTKFKTQINGFRENSADSSYLDLPSPKVVESVTLPILDLWPRPHELYFTTGSGFPVRPSIAVCAATDHVSIWRLLRTTFSRHVGMTLHLQGSVEKLAGSVISLVDPMTFDKAQSFRISVSSQIFIVASDPIGVHYAALTLVQLLQHYKDEIPAMQICDSPDVLRRGFMLDVSRGRVYKHEVLVSLLQTLSFLRYNYLYLYSRFSAPCWPLQYQPYHLETIIEAAENLHLEVIPVIDIEPSLAFSDVENLSRTMEMFVSCFRTRYVCIGPRLSPLMTTDLLSIFKNKSIQISSSSEVVNCSYYSRVFYGTKKTNDYDTSVRQFKHIGAPFFLCCGTLCWDNLCGSISDALANIQDCVHSCVSSGGLGITLVQWSGHMTQSTFMYVSIVGLAGAAWNLIQPSDLENGLEVVLGKVVGRVARKLSEVEDWLDGKCTVDSLTTDNCRSTLLQLLLDPDLVDPQNITPDIIQHIQRTVRQCQAELKTVTSVDQKVKELSVTIDMMLTACRICRQLLNSGQRPRSDVMGSKVINIGVSNLSITAKTDIANRYLSLLEFYRSVWLQYNLDFELQESVNSLSKVLKRCLPSDNHSGLLT